MSKPGQRKNVRQQKKRNEQLNRRKNRAKNQRSSASASIAEPLNGELIGVPTAGASWLGRRIASLVKRRK